MVHSHHQQLIKTSYDSNTVKTKQFEIGDLVLKWDKVHEDKGKHTEFQKTLAWPFSNNRKNRSINFHFARFTREEGNSSF